MGSIVEIPGGYSFVPTPHQIVNKVAADKAGTTSDKVFGKLIIWDYSVDSYGKDGAGYKLNSRQQHRIALPR